MATATKRRKTAAKNNNIIVELNKIALNTTEDLVQGAVVTGEKWQKLYAKSLKQSQPLIEKNVDMAFDTIETLIEQYQNNVKRLRGLFSSDDKKVSKVVKKSVKKVATASKPAAKKVTRTTKAAASKAKTTSKKVVQSDLKTLPGIGPKMEELLKKNGYTTIDSIAKAKVADLKAVLDNADSRYRLLKPNSWVTAAKSISK